MKEFFLDMDPSRLFFWHIAIGSSVIFILQTLIIFIGTDAEHEIASDLNNNDGSFKLYSLRNLVSFLLGFGWSGVAFYNVIHNNIILGIVALIIGGLFIVGFHYLMKILFKLTHRKHF
ncbi:MAG: hypothetical protein LBV43_13295 [Prevotella sp.]|jgi:hypothetical protein|nr:hypothetical protein [Prevotella sp.]